MKMKIEVKVVSTTIIKPSSPTPSHLRFYQLSFIDQMSNNIYNPFVMFYSAEEKSNRPANIVKLSHNLKKSLSIVLSQYYPLAGRIKDNFVLDCSDEGIPFSEAKVNGKLSDVIQQLDPAELHKFVPFELDGQSDFLLGVQLNIFDCGGIAILSCVSHKIADAFSSLMFIKFWALANQGDNDDKLEQLSPQFISATIFPPKDISAIHIPRVHIPNKKIVTKRFVFDSSKIDALRGKYVKNQLIKRPSRVEALSAFISSRYIAATRVRPGKRFYAIAHAFNFRTRFDPPLPENSFGNLSRQFIRPLDSTKGEEESYVDVLRQMRDLISSGNDKDNIKKLQEGIDQCFNFMNEHAEELSKGEIVTLNFTSLCGFRLYDQFDFGWGTPLWVGANPPLFKNLVVFVDTKSGDGIEAYIDFEEEDMARFERDDVFLSFVSSTT
ncbi:Transferase [Parasponia andersonii]|uniref:Transferase n=1 Tax=Parasponia andersonii TaxID=3476 RepID=A0A2P5BFY5_PARAD|nr:Transferase [Parasponia andersonii]